MFLNGMKPSTCRYFSVVHVTFFYVFQVIVPLSTRTGYYSVSPICICAEKNVSAKFKAHLHNDLVSADTLTLLVVISYLEAQSVHFSPKILTRSNHLKS